MTDRAQNVLGQGAEPCATCGAPLAADQRYCLACGSRRASARLPFLDILRGEEGLGSAELVPFGAPIAPIGAVVPPPPHDGSFVGQLRANTGLIAGVGVLLLAMLIGVLIGSGFNDTPATSAASQRPQVIQVGAPAAAAAPAATTPAATTPPPATDTTATTPKSKPSTSGAAATPKGGGVTNNSVKKLQGLSGKDYQKQVDKLGKKISTGGKAPPKDNKPAAGGGSFQEIG